MIVFLIILGDDYMAVETPQKLPTSSIPEALPSSLEQDKLEQSSPGQGKLGQDKIAPLTSLRFIAAALIVVYHCGPAFIPSLDNILKHFEPAQGVSFFFILSGFILGFVNTSLSTFRECTRFWIRRIVRLWPLHLLIFAIILLVFPREYHVAQGAPRTAILLANAFMLHGWFPYPEFYFSVNSPSWSISAELFFYITFPILLIGSKKFTWLPLAVTGLLAGAFILLGNTFLSRLPDYGTSVHALVYINPLVRILEFAVGISIASLIKKTYDKIPKLSFRACNALEFGTLALTIILILCTHPITKFLKKTFLLGEGGEEWLKYAGVPLVGFASLIAVLSFERGALSKFFSHPLLVLLGEISFATYMLHIPLLLCRNIFFPQTTGIEWFVVFLAALYLLSYCAYRLDSVVRRYILKSTDRLFKKYSESESANNHAVARS